MAEGGRRMTNRRDVCSLSRGCTGNLPRNPVLAIRKVRLVGRASPVCAKLRQVLQSVHPLARHPPPPVQPIVLSLPIFRSPTPPPPPDFPPCSFLPPVEPTLAFSSFCARSLQPQPLHRSPLRLQLISLVLGRPFSNFEFLR